MSEESESSAVAPVSYQHKYKTLKRKLKFLVYEQELFKEELEKCHKKVLRLTQDKSFLLDRLMRYESVYMSEDDTLSWLSDEESSSESTASAPPSKIIRKLQPPATNSTTVSASLKVPSKKEGNGPSNSRDNKTPVASKQLPQRANRTSTMANKPPTVGNTHTPSPTIPISLVIRIPLTSIKQQQSLATPTAAVAKKALGSGSSSLSSSDDLTDSDSDINTNPANTATTTVESVRKTILRVPQSSVGLSTVKTLTTTVTKQPSTTTATTDNVVTKATTISQVMSKPTLTIPSQQQILLKPLTGKNATSNISQRLASIYSPTQVKAFQLSKTVTSPKSTGTGATLPFAAFTWSNRTTTSNTSTVDTSATGFTLLSPSNASKLQLPFTSLTPNQTGAFRVIAQTTAVNTTNNDTPQQQSTTPQ